MFLRTFGHDVLGNPRGIRTGTETWHGPLASDMQSLCAIVVARLAIVLQLFAANQAVCDGLCMTTDQSLRCGFAISTEILLHSNSELLVAGVELLLHHALALYLGAFAVAALAKASLATGVRIMRLWHNDSAAASITSIWRGCCFRRLSP